MDHSSYRIANALAGNPAGTAVLEVAFVGPELEFEDTRVVAVAGAEFAMAVDGTPVPGAHRLLKSAPGGASGSLIALVDRARTLRSPAASPCRIISEADPRMWRAVWEGSAAARSFAGDRLPLGEPAPKVREVRAKGGHY